MDLLSYWTNPVSQARFDIHVDVLKHRLELKLTFLDLRFDLLETHENFLTLLAIQNPSRDEHGAMRLRTGDVLRIKALVKADGSINCLKDSIGAAVKTALPYRSLAILRGGGLWFHVTIQASQCLTAYV